MGALSAIGTLTQPITFTSVVPIPGSWGGLSAINTIISPARVNLSYVTLDYGGVITGSSGAQLYAYQAVVTITHSLIRNGDSHGVYVASNAQANIHDTSFISNTRSAIQLNQPQSDLLMSGLSASGNGVNAVFIAGGTTMNGRRQWSNSGIPYVIDANVNILDGDVLSIEPGTELQFTANGWLNILGEFKAIGLPQAPITLAWMCIAPRRIRRSRSWTTPPSSMAAAPPAVQILSCDPAASWWRAIARSVTVRKMACATTAPTPALPCSTARSSAIRCTGFAISLPPRPFWPPTTGGARRMDRHPTTRRAAQGTATK
jgi:hypothetical protein